jgi:hypothetical protein
MSKYWGGVGYDGKVDEEDEMPAPTPVERPKQKLEPKKAKLKSKFLQPECFRLFKSRKGLLNSLAISRHLKFEIRMKVRISFLTLEM